MKYLFLLLMGGLFLGCSKDDINNNGEGNLNSTVTVNLNASLIQKGPFLQGSTISIQELKDDLSLTGNLYSTETVDDFGSFNFNAEIESNKIDISATGFYFNEVSGKLSDAQLTLRTYVEFSDEKIININILSSLGRKRIKYLILNEDKTYSEAKSQAEKEVLLAFNITESIQKDMNINFNEMDISKSGESNAILLAISAIVQGNNSVAKLTEFIAKIADDLESDGVISSQLLIKEITENSVNLDLASVRKNLIDRFEELKVEYTISEFEKFVDSDGDGVVNVYDTSLSDPEFTEITYSTTEIYEFLLMFDINENYATDGVKMQIQVSLDSNFNTIIKDLDQLDLQSAYDVWDATIEGYGLIYIRVRHINSNGVYSIWRDLGLISIIEAKIIVTEENTNSLKPLIKWSHAGGVNNIIPSNYKYLIEIFSDTNFTNLVEENTQSIATDTATQFPEYSVTTVLNHEVDYFYKVSILDESNNEIALISDMITPNVPYVATWYFAESQNEFVFEYPHLFNNPLKYEFQLASDINFNNILQQEITDISDDGIYDNKFIFIPNTTIFTLGTTYYWRVRLIEFGIQGSWGNGINTDYFEFVYEGI